MEFLRKVNESDFIAFIKLIGPIYYTFSLASDINEKSDQLTNNIKIALFIYLFQNLFELLMSNIDACLYVYINKNMQSSGENINNYKKKYIEKRKQNREQAEDIGEHATAGMIYGMVKEIYKQECINSGSSEDLTMWENTIFNKMTEKLRNASAHFNAFYDNKINKIVFLDGEKLSIPEFMELYQRLFGFIYNWMNLYPADPKDENAFAVKIKGETAKMLKTCLRLMTQIGRSGQQKRWNIYIQYKYGSKIVRFEQKENDVSTNNPK